MPRLRDKIDKIKSWYPLIQRKNEEIEYYKKLVFPEKKLDIEDQFLVYSTDFDGENVDIICRHLREFGKLAHKYGHQLIARQECDDEISIYLIPFNENYDMKTTVDAMDLLIERKRNEHEESNVWPSTRIVPEVKMINNKMVEMVKKMEESDKSTERMSEKLEEKMSTNMIRIDEGMKNQNKKLTQLESLSEQLENSKRETLTHMDTVQLPIVILNTRTDDHMGLLQNELKKLNGVVNTVNTVNKQLKEENTKTQRTLDDFKVQSNHQLNEMKTNYEFTFQMLHLLQRETMKSKERRQSLEVNRFYTQRNLEYIRYSPVILEKICLRLCEEKIEKEHSLKDVEVKKRDLIRYFDLLQNSLDGSDQKEMQKNIKELMALNWIKLLYKPTLSEKEEWSKEIKQKFGIENTIGSVTYIQYIWQERDSYFFFCIANSKVICWNCGTPKEHAFKLVYNNLKDRLEWDKNAKFATDMEVSDDLSDYFVHVSTDELMEISDNQKVMQWMTNNFEFWKYNLKERYHHSMPAIYSLALQYFEESLEE